MAAVRPDIMGTNKGGLMKLFLACITCLLTFPVFAADWPQWRGENRDGKSSETRLLKEWPEGGPPLVWKVGGLGEGYSSFAVVGNRLYTQGQRSGTQYVMALDTATGEKIWEVANGRSYSNDKGNGPRGTPTVDGNRLYALGSNGRLIALDAATGETVWQEDLLGEFGGRNPQWGLSESPLVDGERLIVTPGGRNASMVALNKVNGEEIWRSGSDAAGYSSPVIAQVNGVRQYITLTAGAAVGHRASDGEQLWRYPRVANRTANIATPLVSNDHVFVSSDYGTGGALLHISDSGAAEEVYFNRNMRNHYNTSMLVDGYLYGFSSAIFTAMQFETGEVVWQDRATGKGQVIFADGRTGPSLWWSRAQRSTARFRASGSITETIRPGLCPWSQTEGSTCATRTRCTASTSRPTRSSWLG